MNISAVFDELLRDRASLFSRIENATSLDALARSLIIITAVSAGVFGASLGYYKGGVQIAFGAIKVPAVLLFTAAVCAPSWSALRSALGGEANVKVDLVRVLAALAMIGLVLSALAPALLVGIVLGASYHSMALLLCGCALIAGLAGVWILFVSRMGRAMWVPLATFLALFVIVGAQMSWTLRPYLVRPRSPSTPFVRAVEGSFIESAQQSWSSANGRFERERAPLPGEETPWR